MYERIQVVEEAVVADDRPVLQGACGLLDESRPTKERKYSPISNTRYVVNF